MSEVVYDNITADNSLVSSGYMYVQNYSHLGPVQMVGLLVVKSDTQLQDASLVGELSVDGPNTQVQNLSASGVVGINGGLDLTGTLSLKSVSSTDDTLNINGPVIYNMWPVPAATPFSNLLVIPGTIIPFGGTAPPAGYLECNHQEVSRTEYAALFAAIGTLWGAGDGTTTFNVPDLRGLFLRGKGINGKTKVSGGTFATGQGVGATAVDTFAAHKHYFLRKDGSKLADTFVNAFDTLGTGIGTSLGGLTSGGYEYGGKPWTETVGSTVDTRPINKGVLYCIKF